MDAEEYYMISFTRKPRLVSSSITWRHCPESSLRWASFSGGAVIFPTMKSRAVTSDCSLCVIRTMMGREGAALNSDTQAVAIDADVAAVVAQDGHGKVVAVGFEQFGIDGLRTADGELQHVILFSV